MKREILVSITGKTRLDWQKKLKKLKKYNFTRCALFLTRFNLEKRIAFYSDLLESSIKEIPFVHSRHDMTLDEYYFLIENFNTKYFNLHKNVFKLLEKENLKKIKNKLLFETHYHNGIDSIVDMNRIAGFCIDLSHYKASEARKTSDFDFVNSFKGKNIFFANHVNGYSKLLKRDRHNPKFLWQFNYLKTIPKFVLGNYIAIEVNSSIKRQLRFKKYISKFLI